MRSPAVALLTMAVLLLGGMAFIGLAEDPLTAIMNNKLILLHGILEGVVLGRPESVEKNAKQLYELSELAGGVRRAHSDLPGTEVDWVGTVTTHRLRTGKNTHGRK